MKYLKKSFHVETMYMKVREIDVFHKGLSIVFNRDESKLKGIDTDKWLDFKASGYLCEEITEMQFNKAYKKALCLLSEYKTNNEEKSNQKKTNKKTCI
ncbi:hypothetical protein EGH90_12470 [Kaistella haifensis]|nr:hypothetical protein EGH90_12470 [Kaistella haifensis]